MKKAIIFIIIPLAVIDLLLIGNLFLNKQSVNNVFNKNANVFNDFQVNFYTGGGLSPNTLKMTVNNDGSVSGVITGYFLGKQTGVTNKIILSKSEFDNFKNLVEAADVFNLPEVYPDKSGTTDTVTQQVEFKINGRVKNIKVSGWGELPPAFRKVMEWLSQKSGEFYGLLK